VSGNVAERLHLTRITGPEGLTPDQLKSRLTDVLLDFGGISFRRGKKHDHGWKFIRLLSAEEIDYLLNEEWLS
jgi:hypothetical protein